MCVCVFVFVCVSVCVYACECAYIVGECLHGYTKKINLLFVSVLRVCVCACVKYVYVSPGV